MDGFLWLRNRVITQVWVCQTASLHAHRHGGLSSILSGSVGAREETTARHKVGWTLKLALGRTRYSVCNLRTASGPTSVPDGANLQFMLGLFLHWPRPPGTLFGPPLSTQPDASMFFPILPLQYPPTTCLSFTRRSENVSSVSRFLS